MGWKVYKTVPIDALKPYPDNARRGNLDTIRESLRTHGQYRTIVVQKSTQYVLAGNHTWLGMQAENFAECDIEEIDVDDDQARKIVAVDNKANDDATYDNEALAKLLVEMAGDFEGTGFEQVDLDRLLDGLSTTAEKQDRVPPPGLLATRVSVGDVWVLGDHVLVCGDSTDADVQSELLGDEAVDLIVIDPPYGVAYQESIEDDPEVAAARHRRTDGLTVPGDNLGKEGTEQLIFDALTIVPLKDGGSVYVFAPQGDMIPIIWNAVVMAGISLRQSLVWVKNRFVLGRSDYHYRHELIFYGWKEGAAHYFIDDRKQDSVWEFDNPQASKEHPTMKPVGLIEKAITNSSDRGEIVLDLFGGSGTTLLACENLGRKCRCAELDPRFAEVILARWEAFTGRKGELKDGE